jgi:hypothetical protein
MPGSYEVEYHHGASRIPHHTRSADQITIGWTSPKRTDKQVELFFSLLGGGASSLFGGPGNKSETHYNMLRSTNI